MIRGIYIIAEGQTEEEFVKSLVQPFFADKHNFYDIRAIKLETSPGHRGGAITFARYQRNVELLLKQESDIIVTSLIDFYQLSTSFPRYEEVQKQNKVEDQVTLLEDACAEAINNDRFIPYIQLHEFEALLFSAVLGFERLGILSNEQLLAVQAVIDQFDNPEIINDGHQTAPSKRLSTIIPGYQKVLYGNMIALDNGFRVLLDQCSRFSAWIAKIEERLDRNE